MLKKIIVAIVLCFMLLFVFGCSTGNGNLASDNTDKGINVYSNTNDSDSNLPYVGENGNWWIGGNDTRITVKEVVEPYVGENGNWWLGEKDTGIVVKEIVEPFVGENGNWWVGDKDTGIVVKQYLEPYVGTNGNWWYGFEDTGIAVRPYIGENGNWWIGSEDTGVAGKQIVEPYIGANGNWWILDNDTGIAVKPHIGENGDWWIGNVDTGISVKSGTIDNVYQTHTDYILEYLNDDYNNVHSYAKGTQELSYPKDITLSCEQLAGASAYIIYISENSDLSDAWTFRTEINEVTVKNLKVHTKYFYKFNAVKDGKVYPYSVESFRTDGNCPRLIECEGVKNMRDVGGYMTSNGVIKQGMIYRCARLNTSSSSQIKREITDKGIETMRQLGIKTEIDLRLTSDNEVGGLTDKSVIGDDVNYYQCPMGYDDRIFQNHEQVKTIFAYLADESNYPLLYHCNIGTDRTGLISYLIEGLLGVSEEDIYRDYLFSNFSNIGGGRSLTNMTYLNAIAAYSGNTLSEKIENYLLSIGVIKSQINSFKRIMFEPYNYYVTVLEEANCQHGTVIFYDCPEYEECSFTLTCQDVAPHDWYETSRTGDTVYFECRNCGSKKEKDLSSIDLDLPDGYKKLEYIENIGSSYIDTEYKPNNTTHIIADIEMSVSTEEKSYYYFGSRGGGSFYTYSTYNNYIESRYGSGTPLQTSSLGGRYVVERDGNKTIIASQKTLTHTETEFQSEYNMYLFTINNGGTPYSGSTGKLYAFIIYDNDILVRYYIPCEYNNVVGLYDAVSERFFTDKTGAGFKAGPETVSETNVNLSSNSVYVQMMQRTDNSSEYALLNKNKSFAFIN